MLPTSRLFRHSHVCLTIVCLLIVSGTQVASAQHTSTDVRTGNGSLVNFGIINGKVVVLNGDPKLLSKVTELLNEIFHQGKYKTGQMGDILKAVSILASSMPQISHNTTDIKRHIQDIERLLADMDSKPTIAITTNNGQVIGENYGSVNNTATPSKYASQLDAFAEEGLDIETYAKSHNELTDDQVDKLVGDWQRKVSGWLQQHMQFGAVVAFNHLVGSALTVLGHSPRYSGLINALDQQETTLATIRNTTAYDR